LPEAWVERWCCIVETGIDFDQVQLRVLKIGQTELLFESLIPFSKCAKN
jgi:hypothetical protein